jgi:predicted transcriptional regulator
MEFDEDRQSELAGMTKDVHEEGNELFNNRSRIEIMDCILKKARRGTKKTHIMNHCNLSFRQLQHYLGSMSTGGLLKRENDGSHTLFEITGKGQKFLARYGRIALLLGRRQPKP